MKINRWIAGVLSAAMAAAMFAGLLAAQAPPQTAPVAPSPAPPKASGPAADLNQLMRSLFFVHANVFFFAQKGNPAEVKWAAEPSAATDPLAGVFGNWEAVENSALLLIDAADLLMTPGRKCTNGRDVPVGRPDWALLVNELREAGRVAYKAALTKNREEILKASDVLNNSCFDCHSKYRPRAIANRCQ